jgi:elongation factor G
VKQYAPGTIRNVALVGHQECGKTILAEALLFSAGATNRLGKIEDGNTTMDFAPEEIQRQISIHSGVACCEHNGAKINLIDTPGYEDFVGDVLFALDVTESAIVSVRADSSVEVGTDKVWGFLRDRGMPAMIVVSKMDKEHANFDACLDSLLESFGGNVRVFAIPIGHGDSFSGVVDIVANKAYTVEGDGREPAKEIDIPADMTGRVDELRKELLETAAESDEALMEKYLETETLTDEELRAGLARGVRAGDVFPVLCTSAVKNIGTRLVLDSIVEYLPTAEGSVRAAEEGDEVKTDPAGGTAAYVFKNLSDSHVGDMLFMRVYGGKLTGGADVYNATKGHGERLSQLFTTVGKHRDEIDAIGAGDIGAVVKLKGTKVGDTLCEKSKQVKLAPTELPRPSIFSSISPANKGDEEKMGTSLNRLHDEDPTFEVTNDPEMRQTLISGQGELHLDVVVGRLKERFGVEVELDRPRVPYRETIKKTAEAQGRHKKQTGGRGQFGDVWLRIEPLPRGGQFEFVDAIVGGVVPGKFIPAVEKGVVNTMKDGVVAGYPMVDIKVTLYDGSFHTVDSSEQAFKTAAWLGFKAAVAKASPVLLEPIMTIQVKVPEDFMGDVMGDLSGRRGKIQGTDAQGKFIVITAQVPQAELYRYSTTLRSMTSGRGSHTREFSHYEEVPHDIANKIIEEAQKEKESK